jgi:glycosyltransferase involved in cell wall biosynthesis
MESKIHSEGNSSLKVLHVNFSDAGGAGNAARRTHLSLLKLGVASKMLVAKKQSDFPEVYELSGSTLRRIWRVVQLKFEKWQKRGVDKRDESLRSSNCFCGYILGEIERFSPQIVHLHWINAGMLSVRELQKIKAKVVWTLHDLWPVTGSCHYAGSLMTHEMAAQYPTNFEDVDHSGYSKKRGVNYRRCFGGKPDGIVTLCRNFHRVVEKAEWLPYKELERIPNCLDNTIFSTSNSKEVLRAQLGIPHDKVVLLFGGASLHARHKGMDLLLGSLELLNPKTIEKCCLVVVGGDAGIKNVGGMDCKSLGSISDEKSMANVYKACDVFLCPSREDNFPNTVAESSSCGLPVVAYRTGGLSDMIDHGVTGYLAQPFSIKDYAKGIDLAVVKHIEWSPKAAAKARNLYDSRQHADKMLAFYKQLLCLD